MATSALRIEVWRNEVASATTFTPDSSTSPSSSPPSSTVPPDHPPTNKRASLTKFLKWKRTSSHEKEFRDFETTAMYDVVTRKDKSARDKEADNPEGEENGEIIEGGSKGEEKGLMARIGRLERAARLLGGDKVKEGEG